MLVDLKFVDVPRGPSLTVTLKKEGTGLGFSLEGGKDSPYGDRPMTIKKIFTGMSDFIFTLCSYDAVYKRSSIQVEPRTRMGS